MKTRHSSIFRPQLIRRTNLALFSFVCLFSTSQFVGLTSHADECLKKTVKESIHAESLSSPIQKDEIAQAIETQRDKILEGYRLPFNYTSEYYSRRIDPYLDRPTFSDVDNPQVLYRGMFVNIDQLIKLIREGHPLDKVNWTAVGGKGISFSSNMTEARNYIFHAADRRPEGVGVIFVAKRTGYMKLIDDSVNNATNTIYKAYRDIPPEDIVDIYLWGQYGAEDIRSILKKIAEGKVKPHSDWTNAFDNVVDR